MKKLMGLIAVIMGGLLMITINDLPRWGDAMAPVNHHVSRYYLEHAEHDTHVPNVVTAVLADYRGFDTMIETAVVFVAMIAIMALLCKNQKHPSEKKEKETSCIVRTSARIIIPFMQLFGLYVVAHGHYSPGGGFQGGVILGASLILLAISFDNATALKQMSRRMAIILASLGVLIYAGWGAICMILGSNFLDYSVLAPILKSSEVMARSHSMLIVEIGVTMTVMSGMYLIYMYMVSDGRLEKKVS